jgi:hypothetical protein
LLILTKGSLDCISTEATLVYTGKRKLGLYHSNLSPFIIDRLNTTVLRKSLKLPDATRLLR